MLGAAHGPAGRWGIPPEGFKLPEAAQDWGSMIEKRFEEMNRRIDRLPNPLEGREGVLEKRFQEMNRRLDQLRDSLDELRGRRPEKPKEEMKDKPKAQPESKDQPKAEAEPEAPKPKSSGKEV